MIRTENLTKRFDDQVAVESLSLEIAAGEVFGDGPVPGAVLLYLTVQAFQRETILTRWK